MKLKGKGKKFFKELKSLYKEKSRKYSVSPDLDVIELYFDDDDVTSLETKSNKTEPESDTIYPYGPKRKVGKSSYRKTVHSKVNMCKMDASHCYKVLGLKTFPNSSKVKLIDTLNGKVYNTSMPNLTKNAYAFETKQEAMSERLPSRLVGSRTSERLCRVLVSFECWGETHRRLGGGNGCNEFEFLKFMRIEQSLDSPAQHSLKSTAKPVPPHYYPNCDKSFGKVSAATATATATDTGTDTGKKSAGNRSIMRSTAGTNPNFRTAIMTKEVRLKVMFAKKQAKKAKGSKKK